MSMPACVPCTSLYVPARGFDRFPLGLLNAYTFMANPIDIIYIIFLGASGLVVTMSNLIFHPSNFMIQHVLYSIMYTLEP
jgi:hypothetical protein